jgi:hypothetical protein
MRLNKFSDRSATLILIVAWTLSPLSLYHLSHYPATHHTSHYPPLSLQAKLFYQWMFDNHPGVVVPDTGRGLVGGRFDAEVEAAFAMYWLQRFLIEFVADRLVGAKAGEGGNRLENAIFVQGTTLELRAAQRARAIVFDQFDEPLRWMQDSNKAGGATALRQLDMGPLYDQYMAYAVRMKEDASFCMVAGLLPELAEFCPALVAHEVKRRTRLVNPVNPSYPAVPFVQMVQDEMYNPQHPANEGTDALTKKFLQEVWGPAIAACLHKNAPRYLAGGRYSAAKLQALQPEEREPLQQASSWCPLSGKALCETPFGMHHDIQDGRRHQLAPQIAAGLACARANATCHLPKVVKNASKNRKRVREGAGAAGAAGAAEGEAGGAAVVWAEGAVVDKQMGAIPRMAIEDPRKLLALTHSGVVNLAKRQTVRKDGTREYYKLAKETLDKKVAAAVITAATTFKKALEICAETSRLTVSRFRSEWTKCRGEVKAQLALMKGQVAWHKTAMRLVFPKHIDLFFSHKKVPREMISMKESVIQMLQEASTMQIPDAPPSQLLKLVSLPKIGTQTADRVELEKAFAAKMADVDVEAIAAATKQRQASRASATSVGASSDLAEFAEMVMPAIDDELIERRIKYKFAGTGWSEGVILAVADGTDAHKFDYRTQQLTGPVPRGYVQAHWFEDELDWWVSLPEREEKQPKSPLFNGRKIGSWQLLLRR